MSSVIPPEVSAADAEFNPLQEYSRRFTVVAALLLASGIVAPQGCPVARAHLSDFRGQPVWFNFWGSWCPPFRGEMSEIQAAYEQLEPQGFVWLAVSLDEPASGIEAPCAILQSEIASFMLAGIFLTCSKND